MKFKVTVLAFLSIFSGVLLANTKEESCNKMNGAYKQGLEFAKEQLSKYPELANPQNKGLSLKEIADLEKTKSACEVKALINSALINK